VDLFERLAAERPPEEKTKQPPEDYAQTLLDWILRWGKASVSTKDIRVFGPRCLRDRERALKSAQILEQYGWLIAADHQRGRDVRRWQVIRPQTPTVRQLVAR
jgi:hypothetical protein